MAACAYPGNNASRKRVEAGWLEALVVMLMFLIPVPMTDAELPMRMLFCFNDFNRNNATAGITPGTAVADLGRRTAFDPARSVLGSRQRSLLIRSPPNKSNLGTAY